MIVIAGAVRVNPAHRAEAIERALRVSEATAAEAGCIAYRFYADLQSPHTFFVFEVWDNEEALAKHFQTPHLREFQQHLSRLVDGPMDIKCYDAHAVSAM